MRIDYEIQDGKCITPCPEDPDIMVGSSLCVFFCTKFKTHRTDLDNGILFVECSTNKE